MKANTNYKCGDNNPATKITEASKAKLLIMERYKLDRLDKIEKEIEKLKQERSQLRERYSRNQLALDFGVHPQQIRRIIKAEFG